MSMMRTIPSTFLLVVLVCGFAIVNSANFGKAQASTYVDGIINADTTWTEASSPYILNGQLTINSGVTLTIEAGTTINLNIYNMQIDGKLIAIGNNINHIYINGAKGTTSRQTVTIGASNCTIENAILTSVELHIDSVPEAETAVYQKIINNTIINGGILFQGSPIISNNNIIGWISDNSGDRPTISNNTISNPYGISAIFVGASNGTISNNIISNSRYGVQAEISHLMGSENFPVITNNTISNCTTGVYTSSSSAVISNNTIEGCTIGINVGVQQAAGTKNADPKIEANLITGNNIGITFSSSILSATDNTVTANSIGLELMSSATSNIHRNNIYENNQYNAYSGVSSDFSLDGNWWGTTDVQAINQSIYDFKHDPTIGIVSFIPFLTSSNLNAPLLTSADSPSPSPTIPEMTPVVVVLALTVVTVGCTIVLRKRNRLPIR
jgi:parallel beta-helix repeat protein